MITDKHVTDYINSLAGDLPEYLDMLEQNALENNVPIIRKEAQSYLCFLLRERQPKNILEIGTAIGFSAMLMAETVPGAEITTLEKVRKRIESAKKNFKNAPCADRITLLEGDAAEVLRKLERPYDFIFLDAAKGQYMVFLPELVRLLKKGGMLVADNVLQNGSVAGSKFAVERRDRTIHMRLRDFLYSITHSEELDSVILPIGDGMSVTNRL